MNSKRFLENAPLWEENPPLTKFVPFLVLSILLGWTHQLWRNEKNHAIEDTATNFTLRQQEVQKEIEERMKNYGYTLRGARALFSGGMDRRKEFHNFIRDLDIGSKYQGTIGYSFTPLIKKNDLDTHIQKLKKEGFSDYAVFPLENRAEYAPITYVEPFEQNENTLWYDPFSNPEQQVAMELARDKNRITITGKLQLTQEANSVSPSGFLMYIPIYRNDAPYEMLEERRRNIVGWLSASIKIEEFMKEIMASGLFNGLDVEIYDGSVSENSLIFHAYNDTANGTPHPEKALFTSTEKLEVFWRPWIFKFHSLPDFESSLEKGKSTIIGVSWIGISFFLTILSWLILYERRMTLNFAKNMKDMNEELLKSKERIKAIIKANRDAIIQMDAEEKIIWWSLQAERIFGWKEGEILGKDFIETLISKQYREKQDEIIGKILVSTNQNALMDEIPVLRKDGTEFFVEITIAAMDRGEALEFCAFARDITERKIAAMKILEMATHDPLTGLPNRNLLSDRLTQAIKVSERSGESCAVFFVDLDRFKPVNDTFGHEVGDILLEKVAERLEAIMRAEDTTARFWGDEFVIVTPGLKMETDVNLIAEKIVQTLSQPFYIKKHEITIGASVGISIFPRDGKNTEDLLKKSDMAMYEAKNSGKGKYC